MSLETFGRWRAALVGSVSLVAITLTGCTGANNPFKGPGGVIHPQIGPMNYSQDFTYDPGLPDTDAANDPNSYGLKSFDLALARAEKLDMQLYNAMWWNDTYGFVTGLGMFGAGVATLAFGVFDASRALLLGGGLATSTFAGVRTFYPFGERNDLYSKGRVAVQCAVEATQTAVDISTTLGGGDLTPDGLTRALSFDEILTNARYAAAALEDEVSVESGRAASGNVSDEVRRQLALISAGNDAVSLQQAVEAGRAVQAQIQPAVQASTLNAVVMRIQSLVDAEANRLRPNPEDALKITREQLQATLTGVEEAALKARDSVRKTDNQNIKPPPKKAAVGTAEAKADAAAEQKAEDAAEQKAAADKVLAAAAATAKAAEEAKSAADKAVAAAKEAGQANQAAIDKAVQDALKAAKEKSDAEQKLADAEHEAKLAAEQKAAADATAKDPFANAAYWAGLLSARLDAIATKLRNIDSCTATFGKTS